MSDAPHETTNVTDALPAAAPEVAPPPHPGASLWGTGRRKTSVARCRITAGTGKITVNGREVDRYFTEPADRMAVYAPLKATNALNLWDAVVNVHGGGHAGQAGAIRLGLARALLRHSEKYEPVLRSAGFLTRDARKVERKKYGRAGARRRFQFSKR